ncbi:SLAM family member 9-like isoform X2 [Meles meles]|uniref:SLAM family member 9-like isoform X2 n=1 Tax=Meles meles TaxID=9662 RepID=UPI001E69F21B|nr:SLAM family member 9-like isoform X2 [Meles meles]
MPFKTTMGLSLSGFLLLLGLFTGTGVSGQDPDLVTVTGTLGGSVTLPLQLQAGELVESISWMSRSSSMAIATVTLAEAGGPDTFHQADTRYRGRMSVVRPGYSLQIGNLSWNDAGPYRAHVNLRGSRITRTQEYRLQVHEQLAQPRVTLSSRVGENGHCIFILTCVADRRRGSVTYSWLPLGPRTVVSHGGSVLSVSSGPGDRALTFTCVVKNPVSNSSSLPVSVPSSCPGPGILGGETVGETVTGLLGDLAILPLELPVGQEVERVTWSSGGLAAVMQRGPGGQPVLAAVTQGLSSRRWHALPHSYSLQIRPLKLQDSGLYRAWITLQSSPINITKDFTLRVYGCRRRSVQMGAPRPGGSDVPWRNHSPRLLETGGQRQLSLHSQQPGQPEIQLHPSWAALLSLLPTLFLEEGISSHFDPGSFAD